MKQTTYVTRISNKQVSATLLGLVVEKLDNYEELIHYASIIGPQASLKSIWATLAARKAQIRVSYVPVWGEDGRYKGAAFESFYGAKGAKDLKSFWTPLPGTAWQHMIAVSKDVLNGDIVLVTNPEGVHAVGNDRKKLLAQAEDEFIRRFVATLNATTEVPVLPEWGNDVFARALLYENWVKRLDVFGDAVVAYRVDASTLDVYRAVLEGILGIDPAAATAGKEVAQ